MGTSKSYRATVRGQPQWGELSNTVTRSCSGANVSANSFDNSGMVDLCNEVEDPMDHFLVFTNGSLFPFQGDCDNGMPAGNTFDPSCGSAANVHYYLGNNVNGGSPITYCNNTSGGIDDQCVYIGTNSQFNIFSTTSSSQCPSNIIEPADDDDHGRSSKRSEQGGLSNLISAQYALLDDGRTADLLKLVHNENYNANQLNDTLLTYVPFLSDDVLVALLFRNEFSTNKLSHILIETSPLSNYVWKAILETNHSFNTDSIDKLYQYQDSTSERKPVIDSLARFINRKDQNYLDMLYYTSVDTNFSVQEVMDSLSNETYLPFRMLLGDMYMGNFEFSEARSVYDSLKVYFREDKELLELREIQLDLSEDTLSYYDLDSQQVSDLESIAFNDTSITSFQAKVILQFLNDTIYPYPYEDKDDTSSSSKTSFRETQTNLEDSILVRKIENLYRLVPTIIGEDMAGYIEIGENEKGVLQLYDQFGRKLHEFNLSEGKNLLPIGLYLKYEGIYIYRVIVNDIEKRTDRIVKI